MDNRIRTPSDRNRPMAFAWIVAIRFEEPYIADPKPGTSRYLYEDKGFSTNKDCAKSVLAVYGWNQYKQLKFMPVCIRGNEFYWLFSEHFYPRVDALLADGETPDDFPVAIRTYYDPGCIKYPSYHNAMILQRFSYSEYNGASIEQCEPPFQVVGDRIGPGVNSGSISLALLDVQLGTLRCFDSQSAKKGALLVFNMCLHQGG